MDKKEFTVKEAAEIVGLTPQAFRVYIRNKSIKAIKRKKGIKKFYYVIKKSELDKFIQKLKE